MRGPENLKLVFWALGGWLWINLGGGILHFAFELSDYYRPLALIAAVNESVWEHLKMYFWAGLLLALVEYTYVRDVARNYWFAKALGLLLTAIVIVFAFYFYIGIAVPKYGRGSLWMDVGCGAVGVAAGQFVSYRIMMAEPLSVPARRYGALAVYLVLVGAFATFSYFPPRVLLFESFNGYRYAGQYGILEDYEPYRLFRRSDIGAQKPETSR